MQPGQVAQAKRLFMSAEYLLNPYTPPGRPKLKPSKHDQDRARDFLQQAVDDYPNAPSAGSAQQMLDKLGRSTTQPHATGRLRLTFEDRNPLGKEITKRRPFAEVDATTQPYDLKKESFEVFVPRTYRANVPHGLLVWIDAKSAELPENWKEVLGRHKLIWVSANDTGRSRAVLPRVGLALDAVENLKKLYTLSEDRVYVAGFGDGADVAWKAVEGFPDQFNGAVLMMGGAAGGEWEGDAEKLKKELRLVIMSGEGRGAQRAAFDALVKDGFERVRFIEVQRAGKTVPEGKWLEKGLVALEAKKGG
jgi:dienelactone hydrolase